MLTLTTFAFSKGTLCLFVSLSGCGDEVDTIGRVQGNLSLTPTATATARRVKNIDVFSSRDKWLEVSNKNLNKTNK